MNLSNSLKRQRGTFTVELALVAGVMIFVLAFTTDVVVNQSIKGKLDRMSYSLVNVLKERTQLYSNDDVVDDLEIDQLYDIARDSLQRTMGQFDNALLGMYVEQQKFTNDDQPIEPQVGVHLFSRGANCLPPDTLRSQSDLSVVTTFDRRAILYKVTLCYQGNNWFGSLMGDDYGRIRSYSVMLGR
uniref:tight adherence pilus pseudopilin TadF n=1 Tax=Thaumasiovibrio occultus TaxID=1891184 RepID=UPI00131BCF6A|nr:tight adherence pilus pseudopilin TadF [Thaumasiovibrio occultus]